MIQINAVDIPDAHHQGLLYLMNNGRRYKIDKGSFEGETRIELDSICMIIKYPYNNP